MTATLILTAALLANGPVQATGRLALAQEATPTPKAEAKKPAAPRAPAGLQVAGWIAVALGAGALGAGAAFSSSGSSQLSQAQSQTEASAVLAGQHAGNESVGLGMAAFGLGSLLIAGGVSLVLVYFAHQPAQAPAPPPGAVAPAVPVSVAPAASGHSLALTF